MDMATGNLSGLAWGENIGWISFDGLDAAVASTAPGNVPVMLSDFSIQ